MLRMRGKWDQEIIFNICKLNISIIITLLHTHPTQLTKGPTEAGRTANSPVCLAVNGTSRDQFPKGSEARACHCPHHAHIFSLLLDANETWGTLQHFLTPISVHVTVGCSKEKLVSEPCDFAFRFPGSGRRNVRCCPSY